MKSRWNRYPNPAQPNAFNIMKGWFGTPRAGYVSHSGVWGKEGLWTHMNDEDASRFNFEDAHYILSTSVTSISLTRLERLVDVRLDWSRK